MDSAIGGILALAGVAWSLVQKKQQVDKEQQALLTPPPLPSADGRAATLTSPNRPGSLLGLALAIGLLFPFCSSALAESVPKRQPGTSYSRIDPPASVGSFYLTALIQSDVGFDSEELAGGVAAGYVLRLESGLILGAEVDAVRRFTNLSYAEEIDQWTFSARGRVGYLLMPQLMAYGTAGLGFRSDETAFVYGFGVEWGVIDQVSLRAEVLRFEFDDSDSVFRLGVTRRF
jgi:opacity protein-like surface antigen